MGVLFVIMKKGYQTPCCLQLTCNHLILMVHEIFEINIQDQSFREQIYRTKVERDLKNDHVNTEECETELAKLAHDIGNARNEQMQF